MACVSSVTSGESHIVFSCFFFMFPDVLESSL